VPVVLHAETRARYDRSDVKITNHLPLFVECMRRWDRPPKPEDFRDGYFAPIAEQCGEVFDHDAFGFWRVLANLDWTEYRDLALRLDPAKEEARLRRAIARVEGLFQLQLEGDAILFSAFTCMDGYARFHRGRHQVFLGVDEAHEQGEYLDVLMAHELTHVVRESRAPVWEGWGLELDMTHDEFVEHLPIAEHLLNEGFSCAVSERLVPGVDPWHYAYQDEPGLARVLEHGAAVDGAVKAELRDPDGDYGRLYSPRRYGRAGLPVFAHYVWAWQWVKHLIATHAGGDPRRLVDRCSKDFVDDALAFELRRLV
jgi:hypothetical protein